MTNAIWIIIGFFFCAIAGYGIGLHRGFKVSDGLYEEGWIDCEEHMKQHYEMTEIEPMLDDLYEEQKREKQQKARRLVRELDDLFDPECPLPEDVFPDPPKDDDIIDGGTY